MSCARYHCDSQRRQGREGACAAANCQRRCTSRDIILRSPAACTANHELSGSSSAPTRASRRVGRRNQPARRDTLAARMSKAQHCSQRHAESRQGRVRASAGANPRIPPGSITSAAQSFIRSASSEDSPCFALFSLCLRGVETWRAPRYVWSLLCYRCFGVRGLDRGSYVPFARRPTYRCSVRPSRLASVRSLFLCFAIGCSLRVRRGSVRAWSSCSRPADAARQHLLALQSSTGVPTGWRSTAGPCAGPFLAIFDLCLAK